MYPLYHVLTCFLSALLALARLSCNVVQTQDATAVAQRIKEKERKRRYRAKKKQEAEEEEERAKRQRLGDAEELQVGFMSGGC